jgi:FkbH-like protein
MKKLSDIIFSRSISQVSDYFSLNREIEKALDHNELETGKSINIALVSSSTINGIKETLLVQCGEFDILTKYYIGGYNQYAQELLNTGSDLYEFIPDLLIIFVDTRAVAGDLFFMPYEISSDDRRFWIDEKVNELCTLALAFTEKSSAKVVLHNLEEPVYSPMGLVENKQELGFIESIKLINKGLTDRFKKNNQIFVFDYNAFCSRMGKQNVLDYKMYYLGDIKLNPKYIPNLCREYTGYIRAFAGLTKKCIVLDLDNTLWGGVIGEDGLEGIRLGPTPEGRPFMEFQKCLLSLFKRGIILAVNSKNNPEEALEVIRTHPHMILQESHFAAMRMNWDDKVANMKALAQEINIGVDSIVFFDDDRVNREMMREFLPEVTVVEMPEDPSLYCKILMDLNCFQSMSITEEDKKKGKMYAEEKTRRRMAQSATDLTEYLRQLHLTVSIEEVKTLTIPRVSQLTQKTNQFNMTTRRYTEESIREFMKSDRYRVLSIHVSDKFGDNGLTGVVIIRKEKRGVWYVDTFLLSCRIIGRKIEETVLAYLVSEARKQDVHLLCGEVIPSKKNKPAGQFYEKSGFVRIKHDDEADVWEWDLTKEYPFPDFIEVKIKEQPEKGQM